MKSMLLVAVATVSLAGDARTEAMPTMENSAERNERRNIFASTLSA